MPSLLQKWMGEMTGGLASIEFVKRSLKREKIIEKCQ